MRRDETEPRETGPRALDPRVARRVIDALEDGRLPAALPAGCDEQAERELRLHAELLGLLAGELDERPPPPVLKERLLAAVRGERSAGAGVASLAAARGRRQAPRLPAWFAVAAAAMLAVLLGLSAFSAYLFGRLGEQQETIDRLAVSLEQAQRQATVVASAQASLAGHLSLVATPGNVLCPLRPSGERPMFPAAYGLLFLSAPHDGWYVRVLAVDPAPPGRVYRLWFLLGEEMRPMGDLATAGDGSIELAGRGLPDPGLMSGAMVTLEVRGESGVRPAGPEVLFGDERVEMI